MKKKFTVEIDIPENTGDLCWDQDETGLQAFHDCIVSPLAICSLNALRSAADEDESYQKFISRQVEVRNSFTVLEPKPV